MIKEHVFAIRNFYKQCSVNNIDPISVFDAADVDLDEVISLKEFQDTL